MTKKVMIILVAVVFSLSLSGLAFAGEETSGQDLIDSLVKDGKGVRLHDYYELETDKGVYVMVTFYAPKKVVEEGGRAYFIDKIVRRCLKDNSGRIKLYMVSVLANPDIVMEFEVDPKEVGYWEKFLKGLLPSRPLVPDRGEKLPI